MIVVLEPDEVARVARLGDRLGVPRAVVQGRLRREGDACVFLDEAQACRIHARVGYDAKPAACRTYPLVRLASGGAFDVDPGCFRAIRSWRDGPQQPPPPLVSLVPPAHAEAEAEVVAFLGRPGVSVGALLEQMASGREDGGPGLPVGLGGRLVARVQAVAPQLDAVIQPASVGSLVALAWARLREAVRAMDPARPPPWPVLGPEEEAWAVEAARRMVALRLAPSIPVSAGTAFLTLAGAVLCGWTAPARDDFGFLLAAWVRLLRAPQFWGRLAPDGDTLTRLVRG